MTELFVCALRVELLIPGVNNLKAKRAVVRPLVEGIRHRHHVAVSEVGFTDKWQRTMLGIAAVSGTERMVVAILDEVERFIWSWPEVEVVHVRRLWIDDTDD
jgi:uncharacterized protein